VKALKEKWVGVLEVGGEVGGEREEAGEVTRSHLNDII